MKKKIFFIFLTLVMLLTILVVYVNNVFFPVQFKQIVIQKAEEFLNRTVSFDSIRFHPIKGIVITNLNISDKNSPENPFIHVDELAASILYAPIFRDKKIIIPQLTIERPVVSLKRNSAAEWNFSDLLNLDKPQSVSQPPNAPPSPKGSQPPTPSSPQNSFGFFLGGIAIVDGDLTVLDKSVEPSFLETLEDINLKVSLSMQKGIKFSCEATFPKSVSTLKLEGSADFSLQKINAHLHTTNLKLAQYLALYYKNNNFNFKDGTLKMADMTFDRQGNIFKAKGRLELNDLDLKTLPDQEFRGQLKIPELDFHLDLGKNAQVKSSLEILSADLQLGEAKKFQGDLKTNNLSFTWQPEVTQIKGSFTVNNTNLQLSAQQSLNGQLEAQDFLLILNSDGKIDLNSNLNVNNLVFHLTDQQTIRGQLQVTPISLNIQKENINLKGNLLLTNADLQLDPEKKLTGQLQASNCAVTIQPGGQVDLAGNFKINDLLFHLNEQQSLQGQLDLTPLTLTIQNGTYNLKGNLQLSNSDIRWDQDKKFKGDILAPDLALTIEDKKIHLKTNDVISFNETTAVFADKTARGNLKLTLDLSFNPEDKTPLTYDGNLTPEITVLSGIPVVEEIRDISGKINFTTDQITIEALNLATLDTAVELSGRISHLSDPLLEINASTNKFNLEKISLLAPELLEKIKMNPTGEAKISLQLKEKISNLNGANLTRADIHATALLKDTVLKGEKLPGPLTGISGEITYAANTLSWKNLQANFQDKDFLSAGDLNDFSSPQIQGTLSSKNLGLNLSTQIKLMDKTTHLDSCKGTFQNSSFDVSGEIHWTDNQEPRMDFKGQVELDLKDVATIQPSLKKTLEPFQPNGIISWNGSFKGTPSDWRNWEINFSAQSPQITMGKYMIKDISLKGVQANQWIKHFDLTADIYDGQLKADGALSLADEPLPFQINADLQNTNLQKLKSVTIWKDKEVSGFLSGAAHLRGPLTDWQAMEGDGTVLIHDGNIWQLNLLKGLGKIIFTSDFENIPIQEVSANFNIQNQKVSTENFVLKSPVFTVSGKGWVNFQNQLDFNINTEFIQKLPTDIESYQEKITSLVTQFGSILNIKITGALSDPKFTPIPAPGKILEKGIKLFLEGVKDAL